MTDLKTADTEVRVRGTPKNWRLTASGAASVSADGNGFLPVVYNGTPALLKHRTNRDDADREAAMLRWYTGKGSIRLLRKHRDRLLLERFDGPALQTLLDSGNETLATDILCDVVHKLHHARQTPPKAQLIPLPTRMAPLFAQRFGTDPLLRHGARLIEELLRSTDRLLPLHGQLSPDHIHHHADRGWLAHAPHGLIGDPHYDLAPALCAPAGRLDMRPAALRLRQRAERIAERLSLAHDRLLTYAFCHACLRFVETYDDIAASRIWRDRAVELLDSLVTADA